MPPSHPCDHAHGGPECPKRPAHEPDDPGCRQAEESLLHHRALLESVMSATDVMLVLLDPQFNFVWVNRAYAETCGMTAEEMIGKNHFELYPHAENEAIFRKARDTGERVFYKDKPFIFPDQPERGVTYWDWSLTPVRDAGGRASGLVFSLRETTPYRETEEALRASERRYQRLFESMSEGFALHEVIRDAEGRPCDYRFLEVNPAFERLTGLRRGELIGKRVLEVLPRTEAHWIEGFGRVALTGEPLRMEQYAGELGRWYDVVAYRTEPDRFAVVFSDATESRRAVEELRRSGRRYRELVDNANSAIIRWTADGTLTFFNEHAEKVFGWKAAEAVGRHMSILIPDRESTGADLTGLARDIVAHPERYRNNVNENVRRDGSRLWMTWSNRALRDEGGAVKEILAVGSDVTDLRRAEIALKESEEKFRGAFANAAIGFAMTTPDGRFVDANPAYCRITGYGADKLRGMAFPQIIHPDDYAENMGRIERMLAGETPGFVVENRYTRRDGDSVWVRKSVSLVRGEDGAPKWIIALVEDVTEAKRVEDSLRRTREDLDRAQAVGQIGSWRLDVRSNVLAWSAENHRIFGVPAGTPLSYETFLEIVHPEDREYVDGKWKASLAGESYDIEHRLLVDGKAKWVREKAFLEYDEAGRLTGGFGITQDITERKKNEEALRLMNQTLERRVAERTALAEARARQLQSLAVQLIEAEERERKQIAQLLHDDLQQMLAAARMQLDTACEGLPPDPLLASVGELLEKSMEESRRLSHELSPGILHHSGLTPALQWLCGQLRERFGLEVSFKSDPRRPHDLSPTRSFLFRAVQELLFNVVKHAGVKEAEVELSASEETIEVCVSDKGLGFDPGAAASHDETAGLGLLSLRERARYIGGDLMIESAPKQGSRITLKVPAGLSRAEEPKRRATDRTSLPPSGAAGGGIRVLFVDDHPVMRRGLIQLLETQPGIEVAGEASDGREAVRLARQLLPDVVLMDLSMPGMDGIEATRHIKKEQPEIRVIALSAHEEEELSKAIRAAGAEAFVDKAAHPSELVRTIFRFCRKE